MRLLMQNVLYGSARLPQEYILYLRKYEVYSTNKNKTLIYEKERNK